MKNSELLLNPGMSERGAWEGVREEQNAHQTITPAINPNGVTTVAPTGFRPLPPVASQGMAAAANSTPWRVPPRKTNELTPLAVLVRERLAEMGVRQSEFCRLYRFDQGLLSKIQNSVITNLSLESVLRLSVGLSVPPQKILALIDRPDLHELVLQAYGKELAQSNTGAISAN